jgi:histidinol dehydrogenase
MALDNSSLILLDTLDECMEFSNLYAPEHLIISVSDPLVLAEKVTNAGSVFIGKYSCESAGDYASGTNHTLPTNGHAKNFSGVSTESFMKMITFQEISAEGLKNLGPVIELMAEAEQLYGHKNAVTLRLKSLEND